ncbi:hypothetical protein BLNAU_7664 [Blattamonas nauphoetae]|uniref:Uncharacterized protein n=1 Tax=Blattamonas nauphoetae TaxID=2049346 RepID=A0ABQ9Y0L4_9EUKA|nr:hypothetical protein BLNAU_7664 [Blattamonas nauphoetae]
MGLLRCLLMQLAKLSEIFPLVSVEALSEDVLSLFRSFFSDPQQYLVFNPQSHRTRLQPFEAILCNELLACSIIGCGEAVSETIVSNFPSSHPELIDSFLAKVNLSSHPSDTHFRRDRHLNLISTLSQSSSPLFTKLSEPLLDPSFPLYSLLSPRSFTDPASSFLRLANTNPSFFHRLVETHAEPILDHAVSTALFTVRVVSDEPCEPHCLDFGRATQNWVVLLNVMAEVKMDLTQKRRHFNAFPSSLVTFLILSAASTNADMSTAAVSVFSKQFGLSRSHTETLLFATPTSFPLSDAFTPRHSLEFDDSDHMRSPSQSICAEAGCCVVLQSRSDNLSTDKNIDFSMLGIHFAACLVNALHSTTTLPHSFPFFSPELCGLSQQPSTWNDNLQPSALAALTTLAEITLNLAFPYFRKSSLPEADEESRHINFVHLFPFLGVESQTMLLSSFYKFYHSNTQSISGSLVGNVKVLVEMATVNSYNTPIALLTVMRNVIDLFSPTDRVSPRIVHNFRNLVKFETLIVEKLNTADGEERWKLLTQLSVLSIDIPNIANELIKTENDAQALFLLSIHKIRFTPTLDLHLDSNPAAFDRVVELAGHVNNLPLVSVAMEHIGKTVETHVLPPSAPRMFKIEPKREMCELVLSTLHGMAACRREGVEEGWTVGRDEVTSQIVDSCLKMLRVLMSAESFDPTPFVDSLISLTVTTDPSLLRSILMVLQEIEERTRNTTTPFSICIATAPFRGIHESSVTQQPLPSIVANILLFASIAVLRSSSQRDDSFSPHQVLQGLKENLVTDITKETAKTVCLVLEEERARSGTSRTPGVSITISLDQASRFTTPQQLFLTLFQMIRPDDPSTITASKLIPLAPFFTRILTIVVPSSPDRVEFPFLRSKYSQLCDSFITLVLSLINPNNPTDLSFHPLSSLLSVLSLALVLIQSNPKARQAVLALTEEGIEDRFEITIESFSNAPPNKWKGANTQHPSYRFIPGQLGGWINVHHPQNFHQVPPIAVGLLSCVQSRWQCPVQCPVSYLGAEGVHKTGQWVKSKSLQQNDSKRQGKVFCGQSRDISAD